LGGINSLEPGVLKLTDQDTNERLLNQGEVNKEEREEKTKQDVTMFEMT